MRAERVNSKKSAVHNASEVHATSPEELKRSIKIKQKANRIANSSSHISRRDQVSHFKSQDTRSRYIPAALRHFIWQRDKGSCTFQDLKTKIKCNSRYGLEIEHITPFAQGGTHTSDNLTLRCRTHNQLSAIKYYGQHKMNLHLKNTGS